MTDAGETGDDEIGVDDVWDGPCEFCGETVKGRPYVAFGVFAVCDPKGRGLVFTPEEDLTEFAEWDEAPLVRAVHVACALNYFEGILVDLHHRERKL